MTDMKDKHETQSKNLVCARGKKTIGTKAKITLDNILTIKYTHYRA